MRYTRHYHSLLTTPTIDDSLSRPNSPPTISFLQAPPHMPHISKKMAITLTTPTQHHRIPMYAPFRVLPFLLLTTDHGIKKPKGLSTPVAKSGV